MNSTKHINLYSKFKKFKDHWSPKVIAEMNDYQFKLVKIKDEFIKHQHTETDEVFIVIEGSMSTEFKTETIEIKSGEMIVVPKGVTHKSFANQECNVMLVELRSVLNTGDVKGNMTVLNNQWI